MAIRSRDFVGIAEGIKSHELSTKGKIEQLKGHISELSSRRSSLNGTISYLEAAIEAAYEDTDEDGDPDYGLIASLEAEKGSAENELSSVELDLDNTSSELEQSESELEDVLEEKAQTLFEIEERARTTSQNISLAGGMYGAYSGVGSTLQSSMQTSLSALSQAAGILGGSIDGNGTAGTGNATSGFGNSTSGTGDNLQSDLSTCSLAAFVGNATTMDAGGVFTHPFASQFSSMQTDSSTPGTLPNFHSGQTTINVQKPQNFASEQEANIYMASSFGIINKEEANNQCSDVASSKCVIGNKGSSGLKPQKNGITGSVFYEDTDAVKATIKKGGFEQKTAQIDETHTALQKLSEYMSKHNYGRNDYEIYSKDPEWKKMHKAAYPDFHQISDHEMTHSEKVNWINSVISNSDDNTSQRIVRSMENYSGNGYSYIHWDEDAEMQETKDILRVFDSDKVRPYRGTIYRGLSFNSKRDIKKAIARCHGTWNEPGITSFSADKSIAEDFAHKKKWGLVLSCSNNKSAIPFRHMSLLSQEDEVLSPGKHGNSGWKINKESIRIDKTRHIVYIDIEEL